MTFLSSWFTDLQIVNDYAHEADRIPYSFVVSNLRHFFTLDRDMNQAFLTAQKNHNRQGADILNFKNRLYNAAEYSDAQDALVKTLCKMQACTIQALLMRLKEVS